MESEQPLMDRPNLVLTPRRTRRRQRGQGLVMFVGSIVFLIGLLAIVVDVTWYWSKTLQVQRAADAAALAGAVWLPDQPAKATTVALASAKQNGYVPGGGVTVTAVQDPSRDVQLDTTVSAPVSTFFMRLFGINTIQATRSAKAEYVLPVPMGSPLNYFGAFGPLRGWIHTNTGRDLPDPGLRFPSATMTPTTLGAWNNLANAYANNGAYTTTNTTSAQGFGTFNLPLYGTAQQFKALGGVEVTVTGHAIGTGCKFKVDVTPNGGTNWYGGSATPYANGETSTPGASQTFTSTDADYTFGGHLSTGATDTGDWFGRSNWASGDFANGKFGVRITPVGSGCTDYIDSIGVKVTYEAQDPPVVGPNGKSLVNQGVWATALSQGADIVNGDLYSPQNNGSHGSTYYSNPAVYYDYAMEMEPGTTDGSIYVFDPVFCATNNDGSQGMGDRWFGSGAMSTFYDLYDTNNTPYDLTDDTWVAGNTRKFLADGVTLNPNYNLFKRSAGTDPDEGGPSVSGSTYDCRLGKVSDPTQGGYWHNRWWPLATGLAGPTGSTPRIYRIRETTTDPASASDQNSTNAQNSFSLFASVGGHTCPNTPADSACPRVYGLGTMEAFSPLDSGQVADLYMSQIGATYAGKTLKVSLWDPGDTGVLRADLSFLMPTSTGYEPASFTWTATKLAANGVNCASGGGSAVTSLRTNNGGHTATTGLFNGCLLTISIPVDTTYTAPTPPGEPGPGWWKIRYTMGTGSSSAYDLTTWKTQIVGNPVHLVVP